MVNRSKRYSIRVNGIQIMQYDSIKKTVSFYRTLLGALFVCDKICVYDRGTDTYLSLTK